MLLDESITVDQLKLLVSDAQMKELGIPMGVRLSILSERQIQSSSETLYFREFHF